MTPSNFDIVSRSFAQTVFTIEFKCLTDNMIVLEKPSGLPMVGKY